jgi:hypothetical protein
MGLLSSSPRAARKRTTRRTTTPNALRRRCCLAFSFAEFCIPCLNHERELSQAVQFAIYAVIIHILRQCAGFTMRCHVFESHGVTVQLQPHRKREREKMPSDRSKRQHKASNDTTDPFAPSLSGLRKPAAPPGSASDRSSTPSNDYASAPLWSSFRTAAVDGRFASSSSS